MEDSKKRKIWWIVGILGGYMLVVAFFAIKTGLEQMNAKVDLVAVGRGQEAVKMIPEIGFWDAFGAPFGWFFGDFLSLDEISFQTWVIVILVIVIIAMLVINRLKKKSSQPTL